MAIKLYCCRELHEEKPKMHIEGKATSKKNRNTKKQCNRSKYRKHNISNRNIAEHL